MLSRRLLAFVALAGVLSALFIRLGMWQLDRRTERQERNHSIARELALPPRPVVALIGQTDATHRRATVTGVPDYANEFVVTGRSRQGSPGVHIITPVKVPNRDTAILVNRGWVYSADASTVEPGRWRETRTAFTGYTLRIPESGVASFVKDRGLRPLSVAGVRQLLPYPFERVYLVSQDSAGAAVPARLPMPMLDGGPHLGYAIQWFCFAAIALVGTGIVVFRARNVTGTGSTAA